MFTRLLPAVLLVLFALPLRAEPPEGLDDLIAALQLDDMLEVMREEGLAYGDELEAQMFPGRGGARWDAVVAQIYNGDRIKGVMKAGLGQGLSGTDLVPLLDFFTSDLGARITALEVSARRAQLDPAIEEMGKREWEEMQADAPPRLTLLQEFVGVNNLIEENVAGGLNANYAFYTGLIDGDAIPGDLSDAEILSDVWSEEPQVRNETEEWLYSYLAMAYGPLSDDDLRTYIAVSETPAGQALNRALFDGFDVLFRQVSRELGLAAADVMSGQDI